MRNIKILMTALEYIEVNLRDDLRTGEIARACFCSKSTLEKLFRGVHHISVHDYIIRRRMMLAARTISQNPKISILEVALEYGYSTHESFARAFEQIWNCKPSEFRTAKFTELFPRYSMTPLEKGNTFIMQQKHVDISELYDLFQTRKDCYFVLCDVKHMMSINEISHKAGDLAILEQMRRMKSACGEEDMVFRIGGDEFCILTASSDPAYAEDIADKIHRMNNLTFTYEDREIPLTLHVTTVSLEECRSSEDVFVRMHNALEEKKICSRQ